MNVIAKLRDFSTREQVRNWLGLGFVQASKAVNLGSLADGDGETVSVTVGAAAVGDFVQVSFSNDLSGLTLTGYVDAADSVKVRFHNGTGSTVDLAEGTLRVRVFEQ